MPQTAVIMLGIIIGFVMILLSQGVRVIPEGYYYIIERLGVYYKTLNSGIHYIVPFIDRTAHKIPKTEQVYETSNVPFKTLDDQIVYLDISLFYLVVDAKLYSYALHNEESLRPLITTKAKYEILKFHKQDLKLDLQNIENHINFELTEALSAYGIRNLRISVDWKIE